MAKKRKSAGHRADERAERHREPSAKPVFASPFKDLKKLIQARPALPPPLRAVQAPPPSAEQAEPDEAALLQQALAGVRPLKGGRPARLPADPPSGRPVVSEDAEVLAQLSDLVSGQGPFDLTETEEYTEGMRVGLDPRLVTRLRHADFAMQGHIDLHGMTQPAAKEALSTFILESVRKGWRAVLVVHGRGLGSPGGHAVLKFAASHWLSHGTLSGYVLAFTTARPADGGAGALYVLLKRERRRAPFDVLNGAKRHE